MSTNVLIVNRGPYDVSLKSAGSKVVLRKGDYRDVVVYPGAVFLIEEILPDTKAEAGTAPAGDAPFGRDQFNTPYVSEDDRARGEALRANDQAQAAADVVLQPGALDIRTMSAEDLLFYGTYSAELAGTVGPRDVEKVFVNWWQYGSAPLPDLPATKDMIDRRVGWDWSTYHGPLRDLLSKHRGYTV